MQGQDVVKKMLGVGALAFAAATGFSTACEAEEAETHAALTSGLPAYYLDATNGLDTNDGLSDDSPMKTIKAVLAKTEKGEGGIVYLADGTYDIDEGVSSAGVIASPTKPFKLVGASGDPAAVVVCQTKTHRIFFNGVGGDGFELRNLTLSGGYQPNGGGGSAINFSAGRVANCIISGNGASAGANSTVYMSGTAVMENCLIRNNSNYSKAQVQLQGSAAIVNCTIIGNGTKPNLELTGSGLAINCADFGGTAVPSSSLGANYSNHACDQNAPSGSTGWIKTTQNAAIGGNYRPKSVLVGRGDVALYQEYAISTTDLAGQERIRDGKLDIGCYSKSEDPPPEQLPAYYLDATNGLDTNDGRSDDKPMKTIRAVLAETEKGEGGIVYLADGTYDLDAVIVPSNKPFVLVGSSGDPAAVVVRQTQSARVFFNSKVERFELRNLTLSGGSISGSGGGSSVNFSAGRVANCIITGNVGGNSAVYMSGTAVMENCLIRNNSGYGTAQVQLAGGAVIVNCTIVGNGSKPNLELTGSGLAINCADFGGTAVPGTSVGANYFNHACDQNAPSGSTGWIKTTQNAAIGGNYRPKSVLVGSGDVALYHDHATSTTDLAGQERIREGKLDIGCYSETTEPTPDQPPAYYLDATNGLDTNDGLSDDSPMKTIKAVLAKTEEGEGGIVYLADGTYDIDAGVSSGAQISPAKPFKLVGVSGDPAAVVVCQSKTHRLFSNGGSAEFELRNLTLSGGSISSGGGSAINFSVGRVANCIISGNTAGSGNSAVYMSGTAVMENCLIRNNSNYSTAQVQLVGSAAIVNCTIVGNGSKPNLELKEQGQAINCADFGGTAVPSASLGANYFNHACDQKAPSGSTGWIKTTQHASLAYNYRPKSALVGGGDVALYQAYATSTTDLAGQERIREGKLDIGCYSGTTEPTPDQPPAYYLDATNGLDTNDGRSDDKPMKTIRAVLAETEKGEGGIVYLADGTYDIDEGVSSYVQITSPTKPFKLVGASGDPAAVVVCQSKAHRIFFNGSGGDGFELRNLTLSGGQISGGGGSVINFSAGRVANCIISGNTAGSGASTVYMSGTAVMENCLVRNNRNYSTAQVQLQGSAAIVNCTIVGNGSMPNLELKESGKAINCADFGGTAVSSGSRGANYFNHACDQDAPSGSTGWIRTTMEASLDEKCKPLEPLLRKGDVALYHEYATSATDLAGKRRLLGNGKRISIGAVEGDAHGFVLILF